MHKVDFYVRIVRVNNSPGYFIRRTVVRGGFPCIERRRSRSAVRANDRNGSIQIFHIGGSERSGRPALQVGEVVTDIEIGARYGPGLGRLVLHDHVELREPSHRRKNDSFRGKHNDGIGGYG